MGEVDDRIAELERERVRLVRQKALSDGLDRAMAPATDVSALPPERQAALALDRAMGTGEFAPGQVEESAPPFTDPLLDEEVANLKPGERATVAGSLDRYFAAQDGEAASVEERRQQLIGELHARLEEGDRWQGKPDAKELGDSRRVWPSPQYVPIIRPRGAA